jgi:hypothetical protein
MRVPAFVALAGLLIAGCAVLPPAVPRDAYYPHPSGPGTAALAATLGRAARAVGDDPQHYSFARVQSGKVFALSAPETVFYFSDGLARLPASEMDALVAQAVAHDALGHAGQRRVLSLGVSVGFTVIGIVVPGLGLADFLVNPLVVRAFSREQHLTADLKAVDILRMMGHARPRRTLAGALQTAAAANGPPRGGVFAHAPDLATRLAALEPLEPPAPLASTPPR